MSTQLTQSEKQNAEQGQEEKSNLPILPSPKGDNYAKPQDLLVIFPKTGKMSAVGRKIFNVLAARMQTEFNAYKKNNNGATMPGDILFEMPLRDMLDGIESDKSNLLQLAKVRLKEMVGTTIEYESPTVDGSKRDWGVVALVAQAEIVHKEGIQYVTWQYPKKVRDALTQNGLYATLNNAIISGLKTYAAVALYEITVKYKTSQSGLTARKEVKWWIDALSETAPKINRKTGKDQARDWADFKRRQLKLAMEEINSKTDIAIDLKEFKTGKKVTEAQFTVMRKSSPDVDATVELSNELKHEATQAGLHNADVLALVKLGNTEEMMTMCIRKLRDRLADTTQSKVASRIGYLRTIVENAGGKVQRKVEDKKSSAKAAISSEPSSVSVPATAGSRSQEIQILGPLPISRTAPLNVAMSYREERFEEMKQILLNLPKEAQRDIANEAFNELSPVLSRTGIRKLQAGEWSTFTPLLTKMVERFATTRYGEGWDVEQSAQQLN